MSADAIAANAASFARCARTLAAELAAFYPADAAVQRGRSRVCLAADHDPVRVADEAGPHLLRHKEAILRLDGADDSIVCEFFQDHSFYAEAQAHANSRGAGDQLAALLPKIRDCARAVGAGRRRQIADLLLEMLDAYIEILCARHDL